MKSELPYFKTKWSFITIGTVLKILVNAWNIIGTLKTSVGERNGGEDKGIGRGNDMPYGSKVVNKLPGSACLLKTLKGTIAPSAYYILAYKPYTNDIKTSSVYCQRWVQTGYIKFHNQGIKCS